MPGAPKRSAPTRTQPPRNTSGQTKNPEPPKDPPQPVPEPAPAPDVPVPLTPEAAHQFLVGQNLLEKKQPILAGTIVNLINRIAVHPSMHPVITGALTAIALLTPSALDISSKVVSGLERLEKRLDALEDDSKQILENTAGQEPGEVDEGDTLAQVLDAVGKAAASADAAEKAAEESQKMMTALVDSQTSQHSSGWTQVTAQNWQNHRGPALPTQGAVFQGVKAAAKTHREKMHNLKFPTLPETTLENLRAKGAKVLVQPEAGVLEKSLEGLDAKALTKKADLAFEAAWKTLSTTSFPADHDLPAGKIPRIKFITAERLPNGGILYGLENRDQALFLCNARVAEAFDAGLGVAKLLGQRVELFLQSAPVTWKPEDPEALRALERENGLERGDIISCKWVKPIHRRHPLQPRAVVRVSLRSETVADYLIARRNCALECGSVYFRRVEEEPFRCLKCQAYGHWASKCQVDKDICSQCGGEHRSTACDNRDKAFCANCKSELHASWDRRCPIFKEEKKRLNKSKPENLRMFFDPEKTVRFSEAALS